MKIEKVAVLVTKDDGSVASYIKDDMGEAVKFIQEHSKEYNYPLYYYTTQVISLNI